MKLLKLKTLLKKSKGDGVTKKETKNPSKKTEKIVILKHFQCQNGFIFEKPVGKEADEGGSQDIKSDQGEVTDTDSKESECHSELIVERDQITKSGLQSTENKKWESLLKVVDSNVDASLAQQTKGKYKYWWCRFEKFCKEFNRQCLPFSEITVAAFLSHLAENSRGIGGVDLARSSLRHFHLLHFPEKALPTEGEMVKSVIKGIKRRFMIPVKKKRALSNKEFAKLLCTVVGGQGLEKLKLVDLRFLAQVSLMYCTFSRYEESASLKVSFIEEDGNDLAVNFNKGKQYQFGECRTSMVVGQTFGGQNPVAIIREFMKRLKMTSGEGEWLFPALKRKGKMILKLNAPASYDSLSNQFKRHGFKTGFDFPIKDYGTHSFRRGGVTTAVNNGCSEHVVQKQMRVASTATVNRYATLGRKTLAMANKCLSLK